MTTKCMTKCETRNMPVWAKNLSLIVGASILLGLSAYVSIPLPFTPIPIVTQNSLVLLLAVLLGSKKAPAAVAAFLAQGALGLPVFAGGGFGVATLLGPRAGYLVGYLVAAYVVGRLIEISGKRTIMNAFLAMFAGTVVIYLFGAFNLSFYVGGVQALTLGVAPFILGDALKMAIGLSLLRLCGWTKKK